MVAGRVGLEGWTVPLTDALKSYIVRYIIFSER